MSDALQAEVRRAWGEALAVAPGRRAWRAIRLQIAGPLAVLAAIREADGATALLFEAPIDDAPALRARFEAEGIAMIEERAFPERIYRIAVTLERQDLATIFEIVIADLIQAAGLCNRPPAAVSALINRLGAWQAFLKARHAGLGRESVIGLVGELMVLRHVAARTGWGPAVAAWEGPTGGLHDFLRNGHALEVKTGAGVATLIEISSLDQLEDAGLARLLLAHVHLAEDPAGESLPAIASSIAADITGSAPASLRGFRDALLGVGYADVDAELYAGRFFRLVSMRFYDVGPSFPRLVRSSVAQGIIECTYRLDLRALQPHLADGPAAEEIIRQLGDRS